MKITKAKQAIWLATAAIMISGCATRTVVVPRDPLITAYNGHYVVHHVKPAKQHCWKHRNHWHCR